MPTSHTDKTDRRRRLTLTYGVDEGHARTVSVPLARANAIFVVIIAAVVWTGVSALYVSTRSLTTVASTTEKPKLVAPASVAKAKVFEPEVKAPEPVQPLVDRVETDVAPPVVAVAAAPSVEGESIPQPALSVLPAQFDDLSFAESGEAMLVKFGLVNTGTGALNGEISGTATFVGTDGREIQVDADEGRSFRARIRTTKSLRFAPPPGVIGRFTSVRLVAKDDVREVAQSYDTPAPR